jgi:predicted membrane-bound spermidine synthase
MARVLALFLTVMTGFSGLSYEVAWQRYLATLLGSHSEATAAVLAIFLGGLAVGYSLFGATTVRFTERARARGEAPRLLLLYGAVEVGIGVWVMLFPLLFGLAQAVSFRFPAADHELAAFAFDVFLTVLLIGPPTILMGGTIPILTQALAHDLEDATRVHAWIYAFNTMGAFAGALAAGFVLVPLLGLDGMLYTMGCINLAAGIAFVLLQRGAAGRDAPAPVAATGAPVRPATAFAAYAAVALLSGFAMMVVQTVLNRVGGLAFGASHFTFAMVVAVFVLCIAIGSFVVSALPRIPPLTIVLSQWILVGLLALLYLHLDDAPYYAHALRALFRDGRASALLRRRVPRDPECAQSVGLSGALLPLLFHHLRHEMGDLGAVAGRLYSWNTLGSLLGALLGGCALLIWFDLHHVCVLALAALVLGAAC